MDGRCANLEVGEGGLGHGGGVGCDGDGCGFGTVAHQGFTEGSGSLAFCEFAVDGGVCSTICSRGRGERQSKGEHGVHEHLELFDGQVLWDVGTGDYQASTKTRFQSWRSHPFYSTNAGHTTNTAGQPANSRSRLSSRQLQIRSARACISGAPTESRGALAWVLAHASKTARDFGRPSRR